MKILLLGDTSNYHNTLAQGLRELGHDVVVASDGTQWMDTDRDIDLSRRDGKLGGMLLWLRMKYGLIDKLSGYDVVSISGTHFAQLRPSRLTDIFKQIKKHNAHVFQTALATDTFFIDECLDCNSQLSYNEWRVGDKPTRYYEISHDIPDAWQARPLRSYCDFLSQQVEGAVTALYEYSVSCKRAYPAHKIAYGGIPVDLRDADYSDNIIEKDGRIRLFLGFPSHRKLEKGADRMLDIARRVVAEHPDLCTLDVASDIPLAEFMQRLRRSNIVLDQIYSYTPATTALMAMAMGKTVVSGGEEDFYNFIGEKRLRPVVNVRPDDEMIYNSLTNLVLKGSDLVERGRQGREFVENHNASRVVASRFIDHWQRCIESSK